jgi:hypothetical protein
MGGIVLNDFHFSVLRQKATPTHLITIHVGRGFANADECLAVLQALNQPEINKLVCKAAHSILGGEPITPDEIKPTDDQPPGNK